MKDKSVIKFIQAQLNARGLDAGTADGIIGPKTLAALNKVEAIPSDWSETRKAVGFVQLLAIENDIDPGKLDGYWGPQTQFTYESLVSLLIEGKEAELWRPEDLPDENPNNWPSQKQEENIIRFYGEIAKNQTNIDLPYPHTLAWEKSTTISRFLCHERVHDSLLRVLIRVLDHYGMHKIRNLGLDLWGGCFNVRSMRGGKRPSMHSWGIALDYYPSKNLVRWGRDRAEFAKPIYNMWWKFWEDEGWVSIGRQRNFDWMHVQAAKL
ncbi:MAG: M15 family peptidase [Desulfobacteraceae bacterium]|nr:M15 family peptidase [Desulfobacteraceae bacterium]